MLIDYWIIVGIAFSFKVALNKNRPDPIPSNNFPSHLIAQKREKKWKHFAPG